ncbi:MAG: acetylxylan esterase, partial [bacterium]|nr:acetylxylan esterase [bacterium]
MFLYDLPLDELKTFTLPQTREPDFEALWADLLERSKGQPLKPASVPVDYCVPEVEVESVSFEAFDGGRIVGWSITPKPVQPRPTLLFFHGYSGSKGSISDYLMWALQGVTVLTFDVRGQLGDSADFADYPGGRFTGWMTSGILDPSRYYFVRAYVDTVRAMDLACARPEVDEAHVGVTGVSQGGGLALAAASLDDRFALCMPEIPGFCHIRRTLELTKSPPWTDLTTFFQRRPGDVEQAMRTLSYVELNNHTERIACPTLVSAGLQDELCPPSTVYTAFNRIPVKEKQIDAFAFNGHEGGLNRETQIAWV